jgi:hypothetical protein
VIGSEYPVSVAMTSWFVQAHDPGLYITLAVGGIMSVILETVDVLFPVVRSNILPVMEAVVIIDQVVAITRPVIVTVPVTPFAIFPALSVNTRPLNEPAEAYNPVSQFERISVMMVPVEISGQRFP